ncbi:MAG: SRPBCC family protein [Nitrospiraceae bacterium]
MLRSVLLRHVAVFLVTMSASTLDALDQAALIALAASSDDAAKLEVRTEPAGGVRAVATLRLQAAPGIVQAVLTDYAKWPELFGVHMRLAHLERRDDRVLTDLYIKHALLPGERRLLCESRELPDGGLVTTLVAGDFKRYHRTWKLSSDGSGAVTRAEFELLVEVDTWAPDWLMAMELRRNLETHFRILKDKVAERSRAQ